jgi:hypothetical protein
MHKSCRKSSDFLQKHGEKGASSRIIGGLFSGQSSALVAVPKAPSQVLKEVVVHG